MKEYIEDNLGSRILKEEVLKWPRVLMRTEKCNSFWAYASPDGGIYIDEDYVGKPEDEELDKYEVTMKCRNCASLQVFSFSKGKPAYPNEDKENKCNHCGCIDWGKPEMSK